MLYDVIIIGAGASGLCCAISAKRRLPSLKIMILEKLDRAMKKLIVTGNGRCNITNGNIDISHYYGEDRRFIEQVLKKHGLDDTVEFFSSIGVEIVFEPDGRAYPMSYQASSVVDALRFEADELGIGIIYNSALTELKYSKNFTVSTSDGRTFNAEKVVAASGMLSGGTKLGCDGFLFDLLCKKGFEKTNPSPAIVQVKTETAVTKQLKGIKVNAAVTVITGGKFQKTDFGEVLFTDYGLSGPPVLQLSRFCKIGSMISLDLVPQMDEFSLRENILARKTILKNRTAENFLTGFLNKRVGQTIIKSCDIKLADKVFAISDSEISRICKTIKDFRFKVTGNTGFINSQVTSGGISVTELSPLDMQSRRIPGLFVIGELVDADGDCGGYNLQWAWSSAMTAADGICAEGL